LQDIAERFLLIGEFLGSIDRKEFLNDKKTNHAVAKVVEEICEAAYWFAKSSPVLPPRFRCGQDVKLQFDRT
jgi:uncharacterized protein with HEPN domain